VKPVEERPIDLTLPFISPQVDAMVRLQLLTGMRPSEVSTIRSVCFDRKEDISLYKPDNHKNRWRGNRRVIPLGPRSQEIIKPFLDRPPKCDRCEQPIETTNVPRRPFLQCRRKNRHCELEWKSERKGKSSRSFAIWPKVTNTPNC